MKSGDCLEDILFGCPAAVFESSPYSLPELEAVLEKLGSTNLDQVFDGFPGGCKGTERGNSLTVKAELCDFQSRIANFAHHRDERDVIESVENWANMSVNRILESTAFRINSRGLRIPSLIDSLRYFKRRVCPVLVNARAALSSYPQSSRRLADMERVLLGRLIVQFLSAMAPCLFETLKRPDELLQSVRELRVALTVCPSAAPALADTLSQQIQTRLLIPGANTSDILQIYTRLYNFSVLACPKHSSSFFSRASGAIVPFVLKRRDAVECVTTMIVNEGASKNTKSPSSMSSRTSPTAFDRQNAARLSSFDDTENFDTNVIAILLTIYGERDSFMDGYKSALSAKLSGFGFLFECMSSSDKAYGRFHDSRMLANRSRLANDVSVLETIKCKVGGFARGGVESTITECEVMLDDVNNSFSSSRLYEPLLISKCCWPDRTSSSVTPEQCVSEGKDSKSLVGVHDSLKDILRSRFSQQLLASVENPIVPSKDMRAVVHICNACVLLSINGRDVAVSFIEAIVIGELLDGVPVIGTPLEEHVTRVITSANSFQSRQKRFSSCKDLIDSCNSLLA